MRVSIGTYKAYYVDEQSKEFFREMIINVKDDNSLIPATGELDLTDLMSKGVFLIKDTANQVMWIRQPEISECNEVFTATDYISVPIVIKKGKHIMTF